MRSEVLHIIKFAIEEINKEHEIHLSTSSDTRLFGQIDSLAFVNLIVKVESGVNNWFEKKITIADDRAMSQKHSPFLTVDTLADYIVEVLNG